MPLNLKNATVDDSLILYDELTRDQTRTIQRRIKAGELRRIVPGVVTSYPPEEWPALVARERNRILAALFSGAVIGYRTAFKGGMPVDGIMHLSYSYDRVDNLPGLTVVLVKGAGKATGDMPLSGRNFYFPSNARLLIENLTISRAKVRKTVSRKEVEERLLTICEARGEESLRQLREQARDLAPTLGFEREFAILDSLIGSVLGTWTKNQLATRAGKAWAAGAPYDRARIALFEKFASTLRETPLQQIPAVTHTEKARIHFAFLESYFSNFIEGTEFDVAEARGFVLEGKPVETRPKDSHDILGAFQQASHPGWANQTLASGEPVLEQLRARHADMMSQRPEVGPGEFKDRENFAGNTAFVLPRHVRGTLVEGSKLLPSVPAGTARALYAMFLVSEVHPFIDGNGRLARLVMNAELSAVGDCRIILPTLSREEYLDCLRVLTRQDNPDPFIGVMQLVHRWSAAFQYDDLDAVIANMKACNAFEKSRVQYRLLFPKTNATTRSTQTAESAVAAPTLDPGPAN
jgi:hypothetical protein